MHFEMFRFRQFLRKKFKSIIMLKLNISWLYDDFYKFIKM